MSIANVNLYSVDVTSLDAKSTFKKLKASTHYPLPTKRKFLGFFIKILEIICVGFFAVLLSPVLDGFDQLTKLFYAL